MKTRAARKWVWAGAVIVALLWTLVTWGAHALVLATGELLAGSVGLLDVYPDIEHWLTSLPGWVEPLGVAIVITAWTLGLIVLAVATWIGLRLTSISLRGSRAQ